MKHIFETNRCEYTKLEAFLRSDGSPLSSSLDRITSICIFVEQIVPEKIYFTCWRIPWNMQILNLIISSPYCKYRKLQHDKKSSGANYRKKHVLKSFLTSLIKDEHKKISESSLCASILIQNFITFRTTVLYIYYI